MTGLRNIIHKAILGWLITVALVLGAPTADLEGISERQTTGRLVFCHFMVRTFLHLSYQHIQLKLC